MGGNFGIHQKEILWRTMHEVFYDYTNTMVWEQMSGCQATPWSHKF